MSTPQPTEPELDEGVPPDEWCCQDGDDAGFGDDGEEVRALAAQDDDLSAEEDETDGVEQS